MQNRESDAYSVHKKWNLVSTRLKLHMRSRKACEFSVKRKHMHCLQTTVHFAESFHEPGDKNAFAMCHSFLHFFSLVHISKYSYMNVSSTCIQCTHLESQCD